MRTEERVPSSVVATDGSKTRLSGDPGTGTSFASSFAASYLVAFVSLAALLYAGGVWDIISNTRFLDLLLRSGVVALTDADNGLIVGVADPVYYVRSQDPIDWNLLAIAIGLIAISWLLRAVRLRSIATLFGEAAVAAGPARSYFHGAAIDRVAPFNLGAVATAKALALNGCPPAQSVQIVAVARFFRTVELGMFAMVAIAVLGWSTGLGQLFWGVLVFAVAAFLAREREGGQRGRAIGQFSQILKTFAEHPRALVVPGVLSLAAFALEPVAVYLITQAFTSPNVILNVDFTVILGAVVAGHIANLMPVTPGGIGQFEWGFVAALYVAGPALPEAITIAFLYALVRYLVAGVAWLVVKITSGISVNLRVMSPEGPGLTPEVKP